MDEIILYDYWRSSASYRVRIALNLAELSYQKVNIDLLAKDHKSKEHLARHPLGLVPVLKIDGEVFTQSLAIIDYLNSSRNLELLPSDPIKKCKIMALAHTLAVDVHPVCNLGVVGHVVELTKNQNDTRENWMKRFIRPGLLAFEKQLENIELSPFLNDEKPSLAEICLMPQLYNADRWAVDYSDCKNIISLRDQARSLPAFIDAHPDISTS